MRKLLVLLVGLALGYGALRVTGLAGAATAPAPPATGPEQALVRAAAGLVDLDLILKEMKMEISLCLASLVRKLFVINQHLLD